MAAKSCVVSEPAPLFSKLRDDDLLVEILVRSFPDPKSACRCKSVCKRWNSLITGPRFNRRFASHHQLLLARTIILSRKATINVHNHQVKEESEPWAELISWKPRAFVYRNFLSKKECEDLISLAKPHMVRSVVSDSITGKVIESSYRTSSGVRVCRGQDNLVRDIEKRIADCTFIPLEHGELLSIVHYEVGQKFEPHFDYTDGGHCPTAKNGGPRAASFLMYLSDVEEGGETVFPYAKPNCSSRIGKKLGLSVKPKMGDALLFWSTKPDGNQDPASMHGGNAVIKGDKWISIKWMHVNEYKI